MKKLIIIVSAIILMCVIAYGVYSLFLKQTPEKILDQWFNITLKGFDYNVNTFEEHWVANGDGYMLIVIKFNELTSENINYFENLPMKSLPISKKEYRQMIPNNMPQKYLKADIGYYIYQLGEVQDMEKIIGIKDTFALDFKIFIIDTEKKMAVLYYQSM